MVRNHARKGDATRRRAATGENHRQAVEAVRDDAADELVMFADFPAPVLDGADPCPSCDGAGVSGECYEQPGDEGRPVLLVEEMCRTCRGCGRADHEECAPGIHAGDDEDDERFGYTDDQEDDEPSCYSCGGKHFNFMPGIGEDQQAEAARAELMERAHAQGMTEWDVMGAATFGELDQVLGAGAQALAEAADTTTYLRVPCGCAENLMRTVRRSELEVSA
ncbi:hypothetical protein [Streptomyces albireticuli]|uniref:Uncharacterized protein n=1 Tax=Streptomyces albireticuli TaxID=1940 RepID=A0A2A2D900_9ACTN|nr:hypothetical protein [Streptomyces albireticuli]MCD9145901.1 hypothetical protein [Streptomyces albireticuli]MCD9166071.1 hypothetical protein [Streptomyces albireticuli]MCD9196351.1 hypothetical protein [Streptomyces albireticuli]PAU47971.1 hypothetical protein CK936_15795 [Streptomyces albireticuli]